jgi:transketolase
MRKAFVSELCRLAAEDPRLVLITGDLGFMVLEPFVEAFPDRFFNAGAAEQNMMAMATGLAEAGWRPYVYSIAPFVTLRTIEFLRNGPVHHNLPVRIVSVGGGFAYGFGGKSHYSTEDFACLRAMQNLLIVAPATPENAADALAATHRYDGPVFYRLGKNDRSDSTVSTPKFEVGKLGMLNNGNDCSIMAIGDITSEAMKAVHLLKTDGIDPTLVVVTSFNPAPEEDLLKIPGPWITVEEHATTGGLGGWAAETATAHGLHVRIHRCGVSKPSSRIGSQTWLRAQNGLSAKAIAGAAKTLLRDTIS